jgi:hypothetical protein
MTHMHWALLRTFTPPLRGVDLRNMENLAGPAQVQSLGRAARDRIAIESADFLAAYRAATADPRAMLSRDSNKDYGPSLRVVRRFCGILLFFACWAAARHWPQPVPYLSNMLKVAFAVCLALALFQRERFADANLNYWDESLGYIATAVLLDYLEG